MTHDDTHDAGPRQHVNERAHASRERAQPATVECPFCHSTETERFGLFGAQLSTSQYYCRACHTPFSYLRQQPPNER